jgi:hypothetical protein
MDALLSRVPLRRVAHLCPVGRLFYAWRIVARARRARRAVGGALASGARTRAARAALAAFAGELAASRAACALRRRGALARWRARASARQGARDSTRLAALLCVTLTLTLTLTLILTLTLTPPSLPDGSVPFACARFFRLFI